MSHFTWFQNSEIYQSFTTCSSERHDDVDDNDDDDDDDDDNNDDDDDVFYSFCSTSSRYVKSRPAGSKAGPESYIDSYPFHTF